MIEWLINIITGRPGERKPYEVFPEILQWQVDDVIIRRGFLFGKLYRGMSDDGFVYLEDTFDDHLYKYHIKSIRRSFYNKDLRTRLLRDEMESAMMMRNQPQPEV